LNRHLFDLCHVECLLQGNLAREEARSLLEDFLGSLQISKPLKKLPPRGSAFLPPGHTRLIREGTNPNERNGAVITSVQIGRDELPRRCLTQLIQRVSGQRFFDELRTKQQLGYIVQAMDFVDPDLVVGLRFVIQSEVPTVVVAERLQNWLQTEWDYLESELKEEEFEMYRAALVSNLRERPKSLQAEFAINLAEVRSRSFGFGRSEEEAKWLEGATLADLQCFVSEQLRSAPLCSVLVLSGNSSTSEDVGAAEPLLESTNHYWTPEDVTAFRKEATWTWQSANIKPSVGPTGN